MTRRRFRSLQQGQSGAALVEFALAALLLVTLVMGIFEFGRAYNAWVVVTNGAREGARYAAVGKPQAEVVQKVHDATSGLDDAKLSVTVTNAEETRGDPVTVDVSYEMEIVVPLIGAFFPNNPFHLTSHSTMWLE